MCPDSHLIWQRVPPLNAKDPLVEWAATTAGALLRLPRAEATEFHLYPWLVQGSPFTPWSGDPRGISCYRRGRQISAEEVEQLEAQPYESEEEARALLSSHGVSDELLAAATRIRVPPHSQESPMKTKPCKDCGNQVSRRAKTCPACGAPTVSQGKAFLAGCAGLLVMALVIWSLIPSPTPEDPALREQRLAQEETQRAEQAAAMETSKAQAAERTERLRAMLRETAPTLLDVERAQWHQGNVVDIAVRAGWYDLPKSARIEAASGLDRVVADVASGDLATWTARDPVGQAVAGRGLWKGLWAD